MAGADRGWAAPPLTPPRSKKKAKAAAEPAVPAAAPAPAAPQPEEPRQAPDDTLTGEPVRPLDDTLTGDSVPPLDDTLVTEVVHAEEAPTDELPLIEDVPPADAVTSAPPASAVKPTAPEPAPEKPVPGEPAPEELAAEELAAEELAAEELAPAEPGAAEPTSAEPAAEEPAAPEPTAQAPGAVEPTAEEPAAPEPTAQAPGAVEPTAEEPAAPEPTTAEPGAPEATAAEPGAPEPAPEEPAQPAAVVSKESPTVQLPVIGTTPQPAAPAQEPLTQDEAPGDAASGHFKPEGSGPYESAPGESGPYESAPARPAAVVMEPEPPKPPPDPASLVSPERLAEFFAPRSIAVVGASDHSAWAKFVLASAAATGFTGDLIPVHHVRRSVFGRPAVGSLRDLAEPVDLAFILVPTDAVESVIDDAGAAGVRGAIVLASGYRETGSEGEALERALARRAAAHGITLLGPNCLGFLNAHAGAGPFALTAPRPVQAGPVGIALQSGALASVMLNFARARAIGISTLATMGNEAMITATDMIDYLVADEHTKVICLFLEQIGDPARFAAAAERARAAGKPIVALKAGSSTAGRQAALAHTGSVAGDDAVVDAALRQMNVIRVTSIEELLTTAALLGYGRVPAGRRMGVLTASGGACDIIADRAATQGIDLPPFSAKAADAIAPHLPPFVQVRNPLDVTGYFLANQRYSALTAIDHALDAAVEDPDLDFVFFTGLTLPDARPADDGAAELLEERVAWLGQRIASAPIPVIPVASTCVDVSSYGRDLLGRNGIHLLGGIDLGIQATGHALRWAERQDRAWAGPTVPPADRFGPQPGDAAPGTGTAPETGPAPETGAAPSEVGEALAGEPTEPLIDGTWPEMDARALLTSFGVPVVPAELTASPEAATAAALRLGYPVALRISSAQLAHKSEAGGVALGLRTYTQVRSAFKRVRAAGGLAPEAVDGVTVSPMRTGGTELLVGVTVDPSFGPVLAVGLGGLWVEVLGDVSLRVLPVTPDEVLRMLGELRGAALLRGARGQEPADIVALASVICAIADAALSLGDALRSLEVNPLWVSGSQAEALDVLVETVPRPDTGPESGHP